VILDNLGSHKSKAVRQLIRSVGARILFLPKYSPDLNPIEQVFAKLKHLLRKAAARTADAVYAAIADALDAFKPQECANYLKKLRLSNLISSCFSVLLCANGHPLLHHFLR
jgi:transposase